MLFQKDAFGHDKYAGDASLDILDDRCLYLVDLVCAASDALA